MLYLTNFRPRDVHYVLPRLRVIDRFEALCSHARLEIGLRGSIECSVKVFTVRLDSLPVAIGGISLGYDRNSWVPWMVGTDLLTVHAAEFLRGSREMFQLTVAAAEIPDGSLLWNRVAAVNTLHRRWLEWLGFSEVGTALVSGVLMKEYAYVLGSGPGPAGGPESRRHGREHGRDRASVRRSSPVC